MYMYKPILMFLPIVFLECSKDKNSSLAHSCIFLVLLWNVQVQICFRINEETPSQLVNIRDTGFLSDAHINFINIVFPSHFGFEVVVLALQVP